MFIVTIMTMTMVFISKWITFSILLYANLFDLIEIYRNVLNSDTHKEYAVIDKEDDQG